MEEVTKADKSRPWYRQVWFLVLVFLFIIKYFMGGLVETMVKE